MNDFARASLASALVCVFATLAVCTHLMLNKENSAEVALKVATAVVAPQPAEAALPRVLSAQDATTYRRLFAAQQKGDWKAADALMARVHSRILLGDAKAQRYLHRNYTSSAQELSAWLDKYHTLPQAVQVYRLAVRKGVKPRSLPETTALPVSQPQAAIGSSQPYERFGSGLINRHLRGHPLRERMRQMLIRGQRAQALAMLGQATKLDSQSYDLLRWYVANSCFNHGEYGQAAILANASATRSGHQFPVLHWIAGLSEWHQGNLSASYRHFAQMAKANKQLNRGDLAAAAFWAYRAAEQLEDSTAAAQHLQRAAHYPDTFYGIQASKALARDLTRQQPPETLTAQAMHRLTRHQAVRRVLALQEIGQTQAAEQELRRFYTSTQLSNPRRAHLLALAKKLDMPAMQMHMALDMQQRGVAAPDYALYPTPNWQSSHNIAVEPALVFAIARQESGFNPAARSHAGASGVMQLMPETARYLLSRAKFKGDMQDPATNIALGQQYIHHLQQQPAIRDNLVYTIAAYNAGPTPLIGWKQQLADKNDPLLFIESIPFAETRNYVLRVLTNYWIYNEIIGNTNASVHAMLEGKWPLSLTGRQQVASTAANQPHDL